MECLENANYSVPACDGGVIKLPPRVTTMRNCIVVFAAFDETGNAIRTAGRVSLISGHALHLSRKKTTMIEMIVR